MPRRCPWCLEPLRLSDRRAPICPHCERPLIGSDGEPRELDLRYEGVRARLRARAQEVLLWGVPVVAVVAAVSSLAHVGAVLVAPLVALVHLVVLRVYVVGEARRFLGARRRLFTRWLSRFAFLWLGLPGYAAIAAPLVGIVTGVLTYMVLTGLVVGYTAWSLAREREREPLATWEKVVMITLAVITVVVISILVVGGVVIGWSLSALLEWLRPE